jgi:hypothetical protein
VWQALRRTNSRVCQGADSGVDIGTYGIAFDRHALLSYNPAPLGMLNR